MLRQYAVPFINSVINPNTTNNWETNVTRIWNTNYNQIRYPDQTKTRKIAFSNKYSLFYLDGISIEFWPVKFDISYGGNKRILKLKS